MTEYPSWITKAKDKDMLVLEDDAGRNEGALDLWTRLMKKDDDDDYEAHSRQRRWEALESQQNEAEQQQISLMRKYGDEKVFSLVDVYGAKIMFDVVRKYGDKQAVDLLVKYKKSNLAQKYVHKKYDYEKVFDLLIKYDDEEVVKRIMEKQYWQGQTIEQLQDSLGEPDDRDTKITKTKKTETWKYHKTGKGRYKFRITLENGLVVGWQGEY